MTENHGPCFGCTSALGFCLEIFPCFCFCFKQHFHKSLLICALEKHIFVPKHHLVCEITKGQSCSSACVWIWAHQTHQLSADGTGAVCALTPWMVLRNELPVSLGTHSQMNQRIHKVCLTIMNVYHRLSSWGKEILPPCYLDVLVS